MNESESRRLVDDGVISFEQAEGITGERHRLPDWAGPRTVEWLGYLGGLALFVTTLIVMVDVMFSGLDFGSLLGFGLLDPTAAVGAAGGLLGLVDNVPGGIVALVGALIMLGVGWRLAKDTSGAPGRAAGFILFLGYVLGSVTTSLLLMDLDIGDFTPIVTAIPIIVLAMFVWRTQPSLPTQVALFAMVIRVVSAFLILFQVVNPDDGGTGWVPLLVQLAVGMLWMAMGSAGSVRPRNTAFVIGALYAWLAGIDLFGTGDAWIIVSILLSAMFFWMAVSRRSSVLGWIGAFSFFILIVQVMSILFDSPTIRTFELWFGIPGALAMLGALWLVSSGEKAATPAAAPAATPQ